MLEAVRQTVAALRAGEVVLRPTPQGPRLRLLLLSGPQVVTSVLLDDQGNIRPPADTPTLPAGTLPPSLGGWRPKLTAQTQALTVSGAVNFHDGEYGVTLLLADRGVAQLRFDRNLQVLPERPSRRPPPPVRPPSGPPPQRP